MMTSTENPPRKRTGRTVRKVRAARTRINERDRWILDAVARMRFLTTRQIAHLYFMGSRWAANKRLRRLLDAGVIRAWVPKREGDNVYSLNPAGRGMLYDEDRDGGAPILCPRGLDGQLEHLLAINTVRIALAVDLPRDDAEIRWWRSDWEIRARSRSRAIPDATFAIAWNACGERVFHLEVDHHTRTPRKVLTKLLRYGRRLGNGLAREPAVVLVIGFDPHCIERYRRGLGAIPVQFAVYFSTFEAMAEFGATGSIWRPAIGDEGLSLRELHASPYGKEWSGTKSAAFSRPRAPTAARTSPRTNAAKATDPTYHETSDRQHTRRAS